MNSCTGLITSKTFYILVLGSRFNYLTSKVNARIFVQFIVLSKRRYRQICIFTFYVFVYKRKYLEIQGHHRNRFFLLSFDFNLRIIFLSNCCYIKSYIQLQRRIILQTKSCDTLLLVTKLIYMYLCQHTFECYINK